MDNISLREYRRQSAVIDRNINSLKKLAKSKRLPIGNATLTPDGLVKTERKFLEFHINDKPLSELLDEFYGTKGSILDNWIGVLGSFENKNWEIIKVKQLLGKSISDKEIRRAYPAEWSDSEFQNYLEKEREELSDPEIIIYCCAECGDYECGGITVEIDKTANAFIWTIREEDKVLTFEFDKYLYFDVFNKYIRLLERKSNLS